MKSKLIDLLKMKMQPVAVIWTDEKPTEGIAFKDGSWGCVASMMIAASKGRTAYFNRTTFGCPGGGVGLGFGNCYSRFPIQYLLSTGNKERAEQSGRSDSYMAEGERFFSSPEIAKRWIDNLPIKDIPAEYVVLKPMEKVVEQDEPQLVLFFANGDQLSALVVLAGYRWGSGGCVTAPFGGACQSILFGYEEAEKEQPRGVIGFFDIAQRKSVDREILSFTVPYRMFREMEGNVEGSFLEMETWQKLMQRQ